jgi:hypothetical protein
MLAAPILRGSSAWRMPLLHLRAPTLRASTLWMSHRCGMHRRLPATLRATTSRRTPMRHRWRAGVRSSAGPHVWRHAAMVPVITLCIPGSAPIVLLPIGHQRKGNDGEPETRSVGIERHSLALIHERHPARVNPASRIFKRHIAPAPVAEAAVHFEGRPRIELRHQRVIPVGSRAQVHGAGCERILGAGETDSTEQQRCERMSERAMTHGRSPVRNSRPEAHCTAYAHPVAAAAR